MEIFVTDKYAEFIADHIDSDHGMAFLDQDFDLIYLIGLIRRNIKSGE